MRSRLSRAHGASCSLGQGVSATVTLALVVVLSSALSCSRSPGGGPPPEGRAEPRSAPLADTSAFDLAPAADGALLAWAPKGAEQLRWFRFDARGQAVAPVAVRLPIAPGVRDLALVTAEAGLALAWSEAAPGEGAAEGSGPLQGRFARGAWVEPDGSVRRFELGPAGAGPPGSRGSLALAARGNGALVLARGAEAPCEGHAPETCAAFQFYRLSVSGARATGLPLVVPSPCDEQSAQLVLVPGRSDTAGKADRETGGESDPLGRFDYAVCSRGASAGLTVFSIQPSPAYAMAEEVFAGCTPLGAGRFAGEGGFVAACGPSRRLAVAPGGGESLVVRELDRRGLVCKNGVAQVAFGSSWLRLNEPMGKLELLLDEALAPRGSRAVWAGGVLLVAHVDAAAQLHVSSYACRADVLFEEGEVFDAGVAQGAL